ncbi:hypothetical protein [Planotetraspora phitsanulokensis]|uniref:hypothetical protein n=1 Tax=Planotetraspora phitsanulokensis TaxID=575192 RepID=UPI00194E5D8D|nr:hypothetical protein [Planotetraspora phitsanulokensis]
MFMLALTQPGLSYCGVVPFTLRRWSQLAADSSVPKLRRSINALQKARYVVVDEDTEEMLVRSFLRHDGILDSPNMARATVKDFENVGSKLLRTIIVVEVFRLLNEEVRIGHEKTWDDVLVPFLTDMIPRTFPQGFPEGFDRRFTETLYAASGETFALACARASRAAPSPSPAPKSLSTSRAAAAPPLCPIHQLPDPCRGCAADRKATKDPT